MAPAFQELLQELERAHTREILQLHAELHLLRDQNKGLSMGKELSAGQGVSSKPCPEQVDESPDDKQQGRELFRDQEQETLQKQPEQNISMQHEEQQERPTSEGFEGQQQMSASDASDVQRGRAHVNGRWLRAPTFSCHINFHSKGDIEEDFDDNFSPSANMQSSRMCMARSWVLDPLGYRRLVWDLFSVIALCADTIWIPMAAFNPPETVASIAYARVITMYWTLDILLSLNTAYYDSQGNRVNSHKRIFIRYLKSWMVPDVIAVGFDLGILLLNFSQKGDAVGLARMGKLVRIIRATRAVRLLRLMKLRRILFMLQELIDSEYVSIGVSLIKNMFSLVAINHGIACAWFGLGQARHNSWVTHYRYSNVTIYEQYMVSLHWSLAQFTPASMSIQPQNPEERAFALFVLIFGMLVFSSFVASNTASLTRISNLSGNEIRQNFVLRKYLSENKISRQLSARVTRYIDVVRAVQQKRSHASKVGYLSLLSGPLYVLLQAELLYPHLSLHAFFKRYHQTNPEAMNQICASGAKLMSFSKEDIVFTVDSSAQNMFFLKEGLLQYRMITEENATKVDVGPGWWMCEAALWVQSWFHQGSMYAFVETDVIAVNEAKFFDITRGHHAVFDLASSYARRFVESMNRAWDAEGYLSDLPCEKTINTNAVVGNDNALAQVILSS